MLYYNSSIKNRHTLFYFAMLSHLLHLEWDAIWFLYKTPDRTSPTTGAASAAIFFATGGRSYRNPYPSATNKRRLQCSRKLQLAYFLSAPKSPYSYKPTQAEACDYKFATTACDYTLRLPPTIYICKGLSPSIPPYPTGKIT